MLFHTHQMLDLNLILRISFALQVIFSKMEREGERTLTPEEINYTTLDKNKYFLKVKVISVVQMWREIDLYTRQQLKALLTSLHVEYRENHFDNSGHSSRTISLTMSKNRQFESHERYKTSKLLYDRNTVILESNYHFSTTQRRHYSRPPSYKYDIMSFPNRRNSDYMNVSVIVDFSANTVPRFRLSFHEKNFTFSNGQRETDCKNCNFCTILVFNHSFIQLVLILLLIVLV